MDDWKQPSKEQKKRARKKVIGTEVFVQTYFLRIKLECGHFRSFTMSGSKYESGYRGPKVCECWECLQKIRNEVT
jgi:hypothetical protein